ncbi:MAG: HugZ family protein, partial [Mesorhizobium sp.]
MESKNQLKTVSILGDRKKDVIRETDAEA